MKKDAVMMKRFFALMILSVFIFSLSVAFVSALEGDTITTSTGEQFRENAKGFFEPVLTAFEKWADGLDGWDIGGITAMGILGAVILSVAFYVLFNYIPKIKDSKILPALLGILCGVLFTLFIRPEELYSLMLSYKSASLSFLTLIPAAILFFASIKISETHNAYAKLFMKFFWGIYLVYMSIQFFSAKLFGTLAFGIFIVQVILGILVLVFNISQKFADWISGEKRKEAVNQGGRVGAEMNAAGAAAGAMIRNLIEGRDYEVN